MKPTTRELIELSQGTCRGMDLRDQRFIWGGSRGSEGPFKPTPPRSFNFCSPLKNRFVDPPYEAIRNISKTMQDQGRKKPVPPKRNNSNKKKNPGNLLNWADRPTMKALIQLMLAAGLTELMLQGHGGGWFMNPQPGNWLNWARGLIEERNKQHSRIRDTPLVPKGTVADLLHVREKSKEQRWVLGKAPYCLTRILNWSKMQLGSKELFPCLVFLL